MFSFYSYIMGGQFINADWLRRVVFFIKLVIASGNVT